MPAAKPKSELIPVEKIIAVDVEVKLGADWDRYTSGSMLMTMSRATFTENTGDKKIEGTLGIDIGGTVAEVSIGSRRWRMSLAPLIKAAMEADKNYMQDQEAL